jgi:tRNA A-37 threonylcarbamoyl transferase component Bud32
MELSQFLRFAVGPALGKLHQKGLIHKDIKPVKRSRTNRRRMRSLLRTKLQWNRQN